MQPLRQWGQSFGSWGNAPTNRTLRFIFGLLQEGETKRLQINVFKSENVNLFPLG